MFNQLSHKQQQDVMRILGALDTKELRQMIGVLIGNTDIIDPHAHAIVRDMIAYIVFNNDYVADDDELDETVPYVEEALTFLTEIMANYIRRGDKLPLEYANDVYILVSTSHNENYYWQTIIKDNLSMMVNSIPDGKNVSTAIFKAVLNTAYDCVMSD